LSHQASMSKKSAFEEVEYRYVEDEKFFESWNFGKYRQVPIVVDPSLLPDVRPHRCATRLNDFFVGLVRFPPKPRGTFSTFAACLIAKPGEEPATPWTYLKPKSSKLPWKE